MGDEGLQPERGDHLRELDRQEHLRPPLPLPRRHVQQHPHRPHHEKGDLFS